MRIVLLVSIPWLLSAISAEPEKTACKTGAYSKDTDPEGTNIRDAPNGKILTKIPTDTVFTITGYLNDWFQVQDFEYYLDGEQDKVNAKKLKHKISGENVTIPGIKGWIHKKHTNVHFGISHDIEVHAQPDEESKVLLLFSMKHPRPEGPEGILGCSGKWLKIKVKNRVGWINRFCLNTRSNCS